ncbi:hypothetical protein HK405_014614 [Cladochytrium tenue]|nr:hypothetical protein HK405_014614 [Cladochytrium tenue]
MAATPPPATCSLLVVGLGWTGARVRRLAAARGVAVAATTTSGRDGTVPFSFDQRPGAPPDPAAFRRLPAANSAVLVTFPLQGKDMATRFVDLYLETHPPLPQISPSPPPPPPHFILLGSTSAYNPQHPADDPWCDRHSPLADPAQPRVAAEEALLTHPALARHPATVLSLAGLYAGRDDSRHPARFVRNRVAPTREALRDRTSVHFIHGEDVARAVLAVVDRPFPPATDGDGDEKVVRKGARWIVTDLRVYDWWDLAARLCTGPDDPQPHWVRDLARDFGVRALPRPASQLRRALDSRDFWDAHGLEPLYFDI